MGNVLAWVASITVITYTGFAALLYIGQRSMMYLPVPENNSANANSVRWQSGGETVKVWQVGNGKKALIYFGGNAEDVAWNIPDFLQYFPEHTVYLVNYRGYGGSTGKPTESGLIEDALNVYDQVRGYHESISVVGRSLGSAVAVQLAAERDIEKLVLVTPFDSVLNLAKGMYPVFPVDLLLKDRFDGVERIPEIRAPVLVLAADQDGIIPRERTDALINAFPGDQVSVRIVPDTTHNDIESSTVYVDALKSFIGNGTAR